MRPIDILTIIICCLFWAANFTVGSWALGTQSAQPFALAAVRAAFVLLFMGLFLFKPRPERFSLLLLVCFFMGPLHLGFLYTGLQTAQASTSAIVSQMLIPFATILSLIFLKERIGWVRAAAILGAFIGTIIMVYEPGALGLSWGLVFILLAYLSAAIASILIKRVGDIDWRIYVSWMAAMMLPLMGIASFLVEREAYSVMIKTSLWPLLTAALYAAIGVTIIAHGQYFRLLRRYDVSTVVPLTLMTPLMGVFIGIIFLKESLGPQALIGAVLILPCVAIIVLRETGHISGEEVPYEQSEE